MAKEITLTFQAVLKNGLLRSDIQGGTSGPTKNFDQATQGKQEGVLDVDSSGVSVPVDGLTNAGFITLINLSTDTPVRVGNYPSSTFTPLFTIRDNGGLMFAEFDQAGGPVLRLQTTSGTAKVLYSVWEL